MDFRILVPFLGVVLVTPLQAMMQEGPGEGGAPTGCVAETSPSRRLTQVPSLEIPSRGLPSAPSPAQARTGLPDPYASSSSQPCTPSFPQQPSPHGAPSPRMLELMKIVEKLIGTERSLREHVGMLAVVTTMVEKNSETREELDARQRALEEREAAFAALCQALSHELETFLQALPADAPLRAPCQAFEVQLNAFGRKNCPAL